MKILIVLLLIIITCVSSHAQERFALIIGNAKYTNITPLRNPANDANDLGAVLKGLGYNVDILIDADQEKIDSAVIRLKNRLSGSRNSYGFLFFAGHGVQANDGVNYLIPIDADYQSESLLKSRAVSVQGMLKELNSAGNELNIVVLDACRDNPFGWARSGNRGLHTVDFQPTGSIVVFATAAGSVAIDGEKRNGLFSSHLISNAAIPGISVRDLFYKTGRDVVTSSKGRQHPAIYSQYFGDAYIAGSNPYPSPVPVLDQNPKPDTDQQIHIPPIKDIQEINFLTKIFGDNRRLWSIGFNLSTAFDMNSLLIGNINITIPIPWSFIELGVDTKLLYSTNTVETDVTDHSLWYYYCRLNGFVPFMANGGIHLGIGVGFSDEISLQKLVYDAAAGLYLGKKNNLLRVSYAVRFADLMDLTDYSNLEHRLIVGYALRVFR